jgi:hypothetical protein
VSLHLAVAAIAGVAVLGGAPSMIPVPDGGGAAPSNRVTHHAERPAPHEASQGAARAASHPAMAMGTGRGHLNRYRLHVMRKATKRFHDIANAETAGYGLLKDVAGLTCIEMPGTGGMGVHYVNPDVVKDPALHPDTPEALVYAPDHDGTLRLAALEFIVDRGAWDSTHAHRPRLFAGHPFDLTPAPNRFGLDPFYSQHVWVWKHNSAGKLSMWNPAVHCSDA